MEFNFCNTYNIFTAHSVQHCWCTL